MPAPHVSPGRLALALALLLLAPAARAQDAPEDAEAGAVIRLLSPASRLVEGKVEIETLSITPDIHKVVFYVDGEEAAKRNRAPFKAKVALASPPREQEIEVMAYGARDRLIGHDSLVVNRLPIPFRARITAIEDDPPGSVRVKAEVSVPRNAALEKVVFSLDGEPAATLSAPPFEARLAAASPGEAGLVKVEAVLRDGRAAEDVELLGAAGLQEEVDVNLVQLQALVMKRNGAPVYGLGREDFEVRDRGGAREIDRLYAAGDVSLVLGLVLDSSGSMAPIWDLTRAAATRFLEQTITARDRAFVVDFDTRLRLLAPLTGDVPELIESLDGVEPEGGTALFDSILYSLLQFEDEPGRRALVVLTDGIDSSSTSNPERAIEFGRKLGVPIYVVALPRPGQGPPRSAAGAGFSGLGPSVHDLKLLTDPTGGRLVRAGSAAGVARAFAQINLELRHQYVLTYYTDEPPVDSRRRQVEVLLPGRKDVEVRSVLALDQVN